MKKIILLLLFLNIHGVMIARQKRCTKTKNIVKPVVKTKQPVVTEKKTISSLTMQDAVQVAHRKKPSLQAFKYKIQAGKIGEKEAWTGYYPFVTLSGALNDDLRGQSSTATTLGVQQLLFDFAGPQELYKEARHNTAIVTLQEQEQKNGIQFNVEKTFLECWRLQQQRTAIVSLRESSRADYDQAVNQNNVDLLDKNDWLKRVETHADNVAVTHKYDQGVSIAQKGLEFLTGYTLNLDLGRSAKNNVAGTKLCWDSSEDITLNTLDFYYQAAEKHRPEIARAQKVIDVLKVQRSIATKSRLPKLLLGATVSHDTSSELPYARGSHNYYNVNGTVSWNLFDGLKSDYAAQKLDAQKLDAMLAKQEIVHAVRSEVERTFYELSQQIIDLDAEKFRYSRAKNEFDLRKKELEVAIISNVEFEKAKTAWSTAEYNWLDKRIAAEIKCRELMYKCGYFLHLPA
ncbi:MAG: TolC family protein [bacterium]